MPSWLCAGGWSYPWPVSSNIHMNIHVSATRSHGPRGSHRIVPMHLHWPGPLQIRARLLFLGKCLLRWTDVAFSCSFFFFFVNLYLYILCRPADFKWWTTGHITVEVYIWLARTLNMCCMLPPLSAMICCLFKAFLGLENVIWYFYNFSPRQPLDSHKK